MASHSEKKLRYKAEKKQRYINKLKKRAHNTLSVFMYLGLIVFTYLLFYGLMFEPLVISKSYGSSDTREFAYLAVAGFVFGISYVLRSLINYTEVQQWQKNLRLLRDVNFNLDRYTSLKRMGVNHINKRKRKHRSSSSVESKAQRD